MELNPGMSENGFEARTKRPVQRNIRIAYLNVRLIKNREHFILTEELVMKNDFDIFTVSETWLDNTVQDLEVEIPTYSGAPRAPKARARGAPYLRKYGNPSM